MESQEHSSGAVPERDVVDNVSESSRRFAESDPDSRSIARPEDTSHSESDSWFSPRFFNSQREQRPMKKWLASILLIGSLMAGCKDQGIDPPTELPPAIGGTVSFSGTILPIFTQYGCASCHGGTSGLTVTSVSLLLTGGLHGPAIAPGDAANSILFRKLQASPPFGTRMPQGGPYLPDSTMAIIATWINEGAKNN